MEGICVGSDSDRISDLPGNVIDQILACLPFNDVVRTSTLSKNRKEQWYTVPQIILIDDGLYDKRRQKTMEGNIGYILTRHQGKIDKFSVSLTRADPFNLKMWICRLSQKSIQELTLRIPLGPCREVPSDLFSCQQLRKLDLDHFKFKRLPISFRGFGNLVSLELTSVYITSAVFTKLIASCLQLEQLTVIQLDYSGHLHINVPSLKYFLFSGRFKSIPFRTPLLEVLSLWQLDSENFKFDPQFRGFPPSRSFMWDADFLFGGWENTVPQVPTTYNHLKTLELSSFYFDKVFEISCLLALMESALNLETLDITVSIKLEKLDVVSQNLGLKLVDDLHFLVQAYRFGYIYMSGDEPGKVFKFWEDQNHSSLSFNRLQKVIVRSFCGKYNEMKFVQFLLANSPLLKELTVECMKNPDFDQDEIKSTLSLSCPDSTELKFIAGYH
ncbi:F-box/FBD/LRR-repeat protein At1g13570-like [Mercurialis annua]|uniref:F-box/FBD/LRR-repeat protein At1g13570-like n=1 Tax=Mercurialis annua TaxID=3986 RepID=UPI0024AD3996|nr:F-box/FBD/LRR-repeat protein At1g13570-like [Mercurialis annua]